MSMRNNTLLEVRKDQRRHEYVPRKEVLQAFAEHHIDSSSITPDTVIKMTWDQLHQVTLMADRRQLPLSEKK